MSAPTIVAGNWKMNLDYQQGRDLVSDIIDQVGGNTEVKVIFAPPYIHLRAINNLIKDINQVYLAAQNVHAAESGAYTGEISTSMLKSVGCTYVILGHSERRQYFNENEEILAEKVDAVLTAELLPIYCCGEKLPIRESGDHLKYVAEQLINGLFHLDAKAFSKVVIAYEPVWAIGTGKTASPEQAQQMHAHLRKTIAEKYGEEIADNCSILYGGSVKPANAKELFSQPDVNGGLIGGASLKAEAFCDIIRAGRRNSH